MKHKPQISIPIREGTHSRQAHCDLPKGTYERELGRDGFFGPVSHMHHKHPPASWSSFDGPLQPHAFKPCNMNNDALSPWELPSFLYNNETHIRLWSLSESMKHLVRNSDSDELLFIHKGEGHLFCDYGHLTFTEGDYIVIPRGTAWRLESNIALTLLMIENRDDCYHFPDKGIAGYNAIYDPATLDYPKIDKPFLDQQDENSWEVHIKRLDQITRLTYPFNPLYPNEIKMRILTSQNCR